MTPTEVARLAHRTGWRNGELTLAVAVCFAESEGDPRAHNDNPDTGDDSWGLWQVNLYGRLGPPRREAFGLEEDSDLFDPETNARAAFQIYVDAGRSWSPWGAYRDGRYRQYLPVARRAAQQIEEPNVRIIPRSEWGARPPRRRYHMPLPSPRLWLHHTAGTEPDGAAGVREVQNYHMDTKGWSDIAYSFVVDRKGAIFEGRGPGRVGAHTHGDNSKSHGVCLLGHYDNEEPTEESLDALAWLVGEGYARGWWAEDELTGGHRDAPEAATSCPGEYLYARIGEINSARQPQEKEWDQMASKEEIGDVIDERLRAAFGHPKGWVRGNGPTTVPHGMSILAELLPRTRKIHKVVTETLPEMVQRHAEGSGVPTVQARQIAEAVRRQLAEALKGEDDG